MHATVGSQNRRDEFPYLVHKMFEQSAMEDYSAIAVIYGTESISYGELNVKANQLSASIINNCNDEDIIAVSSGRCIEMIIGLLAILKSGKAYLPLDPSYPEYRIKQLINDAGIKSCVTTAAHAEIFATAGLKVVLPTEITSMPGKCLTLPAGNLAYVLYTSGSTGKPKGVCMAHEPLVNLLQWQQENSSAGPGTKTLQFAPLSFDVSFQEIFSTLTTGGTLVLINEAVRSDFQKLLALIIEQDIRRIFLPFIALQYIAEVAGSYKLFPHCLQEIITAGEQLKITPQIADFISGIQGCTLFNQYGPTECHVVTATKLSGDPAAWPPLPSIGVPIKNVEIFITDEDLNTRPAGEVGELIITGKCLAEGYLYKPGLTAEKFADWPHPEKGTVKIYRTGDLGKYLPNGEIEFHGRRDNQVKIRGHRIEPGEIEVVLTRHDDVKQAVVVCCEDIPGQKYLVAYIISDNEKINVPYIRKFIAGVLPDYMIPSQFVVMKQFPTTVSGKVDRSLLPKPRLERPQLSSLYKKPSTITETNIADTWMSILQLDKVGTGDNFFELGGNSLLAQKVVAVLKSNFNYTLPVTKLYQVPTIAGIATFLAHDTPKPGMLSTKKPVDAPDSTDVAVIGMSGRFPGANTIDELWEVLKNGRETIRFFAPAELDSSIPEALKNDPDYVSARGIIDNADQFDAAFFDLNPKLAAVMDPQQRVFMEIAWELLEKTGYVPAIYTGRIGVFAGSGNNSYYHNNVHGNTEMTNQLGSFQVMTVNEKDYIASRTAYQLNLKGPAVSVYSACSTSLLAIAQAVESIRKRQCEVAIAGGASITSPLNSGHLYQEQGMLSKDGHCRSFDADASGTVFSDGAGAVLLKDMAAAKRDGDIIYAVIKGVGINNDGGGKGSFTAPSSEGQANAVAMAIQDASINPSTISYVETHGTGTPLGDPIEIEGLKMAFAFTGLSQDLPAQRSPGQFCAIGSVKSNLGHLTAASGVAGLIKTVLSLYHRQIPASLGFAKPNPNIDFENSPFYVNTRLSDWKSETVRHAGVSSFGVGGTNVHIILEDFTNQVPVPRDARPFQLITLSAKSEISRDAYAVKLAAFLTREPGVSLADTAFTLQASRAHFNYRRFALADTTGSLVNTLLEDPASSQVINLRDLPAEVVFLFPGQGSQYLRMGKELYENEAVYKEAIDECALLLLPYISIDIRQVIFPAELNREAEDLLKNTRYTQPAIFITEYALAKLWMSWGIEPTIFCGHSIGEYVAAHFAGIFTLTGALNLIASRAQMISELPVGSMLSVRMPAEELNATLPANIAVAAINTHRLCVVAGETEIIATFSVLLDSKQIPNKTLSTSHAFHSAMMDPIIAEFEKIVSLVSPAVPRKPVVSTVSGTWLTDAEATDPRYWAQHLRSTVLFANATETLLKEENIICIEVGPGSALSAMVRQQSTNRKPVVATSLENKVQQKSEYESLLKALGQVWLHGIQPDWTKFHEGQGRGKMDLPTYSFDRKRCWVDPVINMIPNQVKIIGNEKTMEKMPTQIIQRKDTLTNKVKQVLEDASGIDTGRLPGDTTLVEMGMDSLLMTQLALTLKKEFGLPFKFRQLTEELATTDLLVKYLDENLPFALYRPSAIEATTEMRQLKALPTPAQLPVENKVDDLTSIAEQLQMLIKKVGVMQAGTPATNGIEKVQEDRPASTALPAITSNIISGDLTPEEVIELKKPFGAIARIEREITRLTEKQKAFILQLTEQYNQKTKGSKAYAQQHRSYMSDPRVVSGFKPLTKELIYPIVVNRSRGSRFWDIDGNEYLDLLNGFGSSMFGYQPDFIKKALHEQVEKGFEIGPQHELAGEVCKMICDLTGSDRAALCNTGSEAVLGTMRIARTVTGRSLIVAFTGAYHGIIDEALVRGTKKLKSYPATAGIMREALQNMLILDYGTDESLEIIRSRAHELAAILVEPVQSRRPEFRPVEFLRQLRDISTSSGAVLIFDEVITGFRLHPGGAQGLFGIKADIASYGKVVGGGLPIGAIAGKKELLDALDGGYWQYGDNSFPEAGVTYFAGTFVRHPLALATAKAALEYMIHKGPDLQLALNEKGDRIASALNKALEKRTLPFFVAQFGSLWKIKFKEDVPYGELLFTSMRLKGVHVCDGFPCFITEVHTNEEIDFVVQLFIESVDEMIDAGFFRQPVALTDAGNNEISPSYFSTPPVPGAKLGRNEEGDPAWYIADRNRPGKFLEVV